MQWDHSEDSYGIEKKNRHDLVLSCNFHKRNFFSSRTISAQPHPLMRHSQTRGAIWNRRKRTKRAHEQRLQQKL